MTDSINSLKEALNSLHNCQVEGCGICRISVEHVFFELDLLQEQIERKDKNIVRLERIIEQTTRFLLTGKMDEI